MGEPCFRINSPSVIYEQFGDELVAIHLGKGTYHGMTGSATDVFMLLSEEATLGELADALAAKYGVAPGEIADTLAPFLEQLQNEQLIVPVETRKSRDPLRLAGNGGTAPSLEAFKDLEGLLLLDPIHEIGDEGWPPPSQPSPK
jgi:hypothetical protein